MEIFLDTANIEEIKKGASLGIISGVTTNPSLIAREGRDLKEVVMEIVSLIDGPISAEVISLDYEGMVREAEELSKLHPNITIKIPMTWDGIRAVKTLSSMGIKTNVTLVFSANQALLAALAGATFVSPFVGRLDDTGHDGVYLIEEIKTIYENYNFKTKIIAASIRHPLHVTQVAKAGADIATVPFKVLTQMFAHPQTKEGIEKFLADWQAMKR
ncbi:fructose-6-phosphate aldolase [Carboxydothermus hydrogenoformans]|uniref:Probable transaldolase n=1 Tax=Carboxydothermus hydrogenoformans (strain ATCC BAA-161 / DSM 6008 / Z-2901) TaxID=246194 RepID=TAL_CARHZ|nr:fructose-6-phosphate aldolase [Carboxydothermus hydrogenoformans]Q3AFT3.1 RecName: Full=Probable transaldolase [Carboxydothermus hydrogenoformans Z-2901]ABB14561.1 putative transaldolase [Carboxydothermus hydrogenoformans Z-2901]